MDKRLIKDIDDVLYIIMKQMINIIMKKRMEVIL